MKRFAKALASMAIVGTLAFGAWTVAGSQVVAGGETRTISLYQVHTKESLTITYMQNGRYVPSAMKQVNRLMRDWRRNEVTTIDPKTLDLLWELHADLGSQRPIHIICGYRSPKTNAFLKKIGRNVARKSQHMRGKAIDFYFPDVPTVKIRNSALVRRIGGVGYYRSSGGPTGFLHVDSGNVRHWGPGMNRSQMAAALRDGQKYVGKRLTNKSADMVPVQQVADENAEEEKSGGIWGLVSTKFGNKKQNSVQPVQAPLEAAYASDEDALAQWSEDAAQTGLESVSETAPLDAAISSAAPRKASQPVNPDTDGLASMAQTAAVESLADGTAGAGEPALAKGYILKPRLKPGSVVQMATVGLDGDVNIQPASAPPEPQTFSRKPSQVADMLGVVETAETLAEEPEILQTSNTETKTSFAAQLRDGTAEDAPIIEPVMASVETTDTSWWNRLFSSAEEVQRRDGAPPDLNAEVPDVMPKPAVLGPDGSGIVGQHAAEGKGDLQLVNRDGKGSLPPMKLRLTQVQPEIEQIQ